MRFTDRLHKYTSIFSREDWIEYIEANPKKKYWRSKLTNIFSMGFRMPAFIFHEACHLMASWVLMLDMVITDVFLMKYMKDKNRLNYFTLSVMFVNVSSMRRRVAIASAAPLMGYVLGVAAITMAVGFHLGYGSHWMATIDLILLWYMTSQYGSFSLSTQDREAFKKMLDSIKIERYEKRRRSGIDSRKVVPSKGKLS